MKPRNTVLLSRIFLRHSWKMPGTATPEGSHRWPSSGSAGKCHEKTLKFQISQISRPQTLPSRLLTQFHANFTFVNVKGTCDFFVKYHYFNISVDCMSLDLPNIPHNFTISSCFCSGHHGMVVPAKTLRQEPISFRICAIQLRHP